MMDAKRVMVNMQRDLEKEGETYLLTAGGLNTEAGKLRHEKQQAREAELARLKDPFI